MSIVVIRIEFEKPANEITDDDVLDYMAEIVEQENVRWTIEGDE